MGIFRRISDIINSNINYILDQAEDPEKMISQMILEMEEGIRSAKLSAARAIASEKKLKKSLDFHVRKAEEWKEKAESALEDGNEEHARKALNRKKEHANIAKSLEAQHEEAEKAGDTLRINLRALEGKLAEAKRKRDTLVARKRAAEACKEVHLQVGNLEKTASAFSKFERMEEKVESAEAEAAALAEMAEDEKLVREEFEKLTEDKDIDLELESLKEEVKRRKERSKEAEKGSKESREK